MYKGDAKHVKVLSKRKTLFQERANKVCPTDNLAKLLSSTVKPT